MQIIQQEFQEQREEQSKKNEQISVQLETLSSQFQAFLAHHVMGNEMGSTSKGILQTPARGNLEGIPSKGKGPMKGDANYGQEQHRAMFSAGFPKLDLTTFRGDNPRGWLRRCNKFFKLNATLWQQWVEIASLYLEGKAEIWFEGYMCGLDVNIEWEEFSKAICSRFGSREDVVEEFNKLKQENGMEEYVERFEDLKSLMHSLSPILPESYYISSFISGLKEDIKPMLKILKPGTLMTAFDQAKWQEESNNILARKNRFTTKPGMGRSFGNPQSTYVSNNLQTPKVSETMYE